MLQGKSALVTGSTSGIGRAIALMLAAKGANVMLNGFGDRAEIDRLIKEARGVASGEIAYSPADMTKPDEISDMVAAAKRGFGSVDIVVNNAGIQYVSPVEEFPVEKWDAIIAINLSSSFHTIRHTIADMKTAGWGRIVNIASAHSLVASPYKAAYVAAKHGIAGLTKTIALEAAEHGVTRNQIWEFLGDKARPRCRWALNKNTVLSTSNLLLCSPYQDPIFEDIFWSPCLKTALDQDRLGHYLDKHTVETCGWDVCTKRLY